MCGVFSRSHSVVSPCLLHCSYYSLALCVCCVWTYGPFPPRSHSLTYFGSLAHSATLCWVLCVCVRIYMFRVQQARAFTALEKRFTYPQTIVCINEWDSICKETIGIKVNIVNIQLFDRKESSKWLPHIYYECERVSERIFSFCFSCTHTHCFFSVFAMHFFSFSTRFHFLFQINRNSLFLAPSYLF